MKFASRMRNYPVCLIEPDFMRSRRDRRNHPKYLEADLIKMLGLDSYIVLVERFGGARLYVAKGLTEQNQLRDLLGEEKAALLAEAYGGEHPRFPLGITVRAIRYREEGLSNPQIARRLVMTDNGIDKLFARLARENEA